MHGTLVSPPLLLHWRLPVHFALHSYIVLLYPFSEGIHVLCCRVPVVFFVDILLAMVVSSRWVDIAPSV